MSIARCLQRGVDRLLGGRGEQSITVPVMDGALKPNDRLERAGRMAMVEDADHLVWAGGRLLCSSRDRVVAIAADGPVGTAFEAEGMISCLATDGQGALAVGLEARGVRLIGGRHDGALIDRAGTIALFCPTAAMFLDPDRLVVANGSARFVPSLWRHDLLDGGRSGSVVLIDLANATSRVMADGLAYPAGLCQAQDEPALLLVTEAWRHRIIRLTVDQTVADEALAALPAYPGCIAASRAGGYWLSCFAPRSQLQEFVLREDRYRRKMMAEVDPEYWIAPALSSGRSFKEPLQAGGVIRLGVHKPWAPTRSYGLVVRLDANVQPVWSLHSRANGTRHGITSVVETPAGLAAASKGRGEVIVIPEIALDEPDDLQPGEPA